MSRAHPGKSDTYKEKIRVRKNREKERKVFKQAKSEFFEIYGNEAPINRAKIRRLKEQIKKNKRINKPFWFKK